VKLVKHRLRGYMMRRRRRPIQWQCAE